MTETHIYMVATNLCLLGVKTHLQVHEEYFCLAFHFRTNSYLNET